MNPEYIVRTQSDRAYRYSFGEVVIPGVTLFRDGNTDLTQEQVNLKLLNATTPKKAH